MSLEDQIPVDDLRRLYVQANLRQRFSVAVSRIHHPDHGPNQVVAAVAALEGFARAIAVRSEVSSGMSLETAYSRLKWKGPVELVEDFALPALGTNVTELFSPELWASVKFAVDFRNLLVHEATYLGGAMCEVFVQAVLDVLMPMARLAGVDPDTA